MAQASDYIKSRFRSLAGSALTDRCEFTYHLAAAASFLYAVRACRANFVAKLLPAYHILTRGISV